jgi:hypothetical protein
MLIIAGAWLLSMIIVWTYRGWQVEEKINRAWELKIASSVPETTKTITERSEEQPSYSGGVKPATVYIQNDVDQLLKLERDSLRALLDRLIQPKIFRIQNPQIGTFILAYYPLRDSSNYDHHPPPKVTRVELLDIKQPVLRERPWWEVPAYVAGTALATWAIVHARK